MARLRERAIVTEPTPEIVTHASLRIVELPAGAFGLITLDNGLEQRKPNTFGEQGLRSIGQLIDAASAHPGVVGLGITGKEGSFAAGADLTAMVRIQSYDDALAVGVQGHSVFRRLAESGVPTFAFINAAAVGGGLEIALHAHHRTVSSAAPAIALPECYLGLVPGWGGTQLLPRLIGIEQALQVIIENPLSGNRMLTGSQAASLGIADVLFEPADFLEESLQWASEIIAGTREVTRRPLDQKPLWQGSVAAARSRLDDRLHGAVPAPYRALQLIELAATADLDTGFAAEDHALAELMMTDEMRASLYAFRLMRTRSSVAVEDAPASVLDRLLCRFVGEITRAVDQGTPVELAETALWPLGLPMSLRELIDLTGPAGALHGVPDDTTAPGPAALTAEEVRRRALTALCEEAFLILDENAVADPREIDLCLLTGAGFPLHLGGITPYLDREGVSASVAGRRFLPPGIASRA